MKRKMVYSITLIFTVSIILSFFVFDTNALKRTAAYRVKINPVIGGIFQSGKTIKLGIMRSSDQKRFNFATLTWVSSDWTDDMRVTVTEDTSYFPYYYYDWTYPANHTTTTDIVYTFFAKGIDFNFYDIQDISWEQITFGMVQP